MVVLLPFNTTIWFYRQPIDFRKQIDGIVILVADKRVFNIDITICSRCGGAASIIACIEDPSIINKILAHLDTKSGAPAAVNQLPDPRAPPQAKLFT